MADSEVIDFIESLMERAEEMQRAPDLVNDLMLRKRHLHHHYHCLRCDKDAAMTFIIGTLTHGLRYLDLCPLCDMWLKMGLD